MNNKKSIRVFGLLLFFGLCIAMLSKVTTVSAAENDVKLNVSEVSVILEGTYRLRVYNLLPGQTVTYRSSDNSIAFVSNNGKITGTSCGDAVITATVMEGGTRVATLQCDVHIGPAAASIKLTKSELILKAGRTKFLKTIVYPLNTAETATFYSMDSSIAKISTAGRVSAESEGTVKVYAFISNGTYAVCDVTVLSEENYRKYLDGMSLEEILNEEEEPVEDLSEEASSVTEAE